MFPKHIPDISQREKNYAKNKVLSDTPHHFNNSPYINPSFEFMFCMNEYFLHHNHIDSMEGQMRRLDLDTVCSMELYKLKKAVLEENALDLSTWKLQE
mmetsp:Transcript_10116/g.8911  ORF Transcript_10116/g.8911 Transcript_10116/m.8911 type:complete len:98 (-) Transcript_10116:49-342(-)